MLVVSDVVEKRQIVVEVESVVVEKITTSEWVEFNAPLDTI